MKARRRDVFDLFCARPRSQSRTSRLPDFMFFSRFGVVCRVGQCPQERDDGVEFVIVQAWDLGGVAVDAARDVELHDVA